MTIIRKLCKRIQEIRLWRIFNKRTQFSFYFLLSRWKKNCLSLILFFQENDRDYENFLFCRDLTFSVTIVLNRHLPIKILAFSVMTFVNYTWFLSSFLQSKYTQDVKKGSFPFSQNITRIIRSTNTFVSLSCSGCSETATGCVL